MRRQFAASLYIPRKLAHKRGNVAQHLANFPFFGKGKLSPGIAYLHRGERLNEQGSAGVGCVVDYSWKPTAHLCLYLYDEAVVTDGYDIVLQHIVGLRGLDERCQRVCYALVCLPNLAAQCAQSVRCVIAHLAPVADARPYLPRQFAYVRDALRDVCEHRGVLSHGEDAASGARMHIERLRDGEQFHTTEDSADRSPHDRFADVVWTEHIHFAGFVQNGAAFGGLLLKQRHLVLVV